MRKNSFAFRLFMCFLSVLVLAVYIILEIKGYHVGFSSWIMIVFAIVMWCWLSYSEYKQRK